MSVAALSSHSIQLRPFISHTRGAIFLASPFFFSSIEIAVVGRFYCSDDHFIALYNSIIVKWSKNGPLFFKTHTNNILKTGTRTHYSNGRCLAGIGFDSKGSLAMRPTPDEPLLSPGDVPDSYSPAAWGAIKIEIKLFHTATGNASATSATIKVSFCLIPVTLSVPFGSDDSRLFKGWLHDGIYWPNHGSFIFIYARSNGDGSEIGWMSATSWIEGKISAVKVVTPIPQKSSKAFFSLLLTYELIFKNLLHCVLNRRTKYPALS